jgi:hypothetical protein
MKKFLLYSLISFCIFLHANGQGQLTGACDIADIVISNVRPVASSGTTCTVTFDVSFTLDANNGNKYIYGASWLESQYPNYFNCTSGVLPNGAVKAPVAANLTNAFLRLGIDNSGTQPVLLTSYLPDPSVTLNTVGSISTFVLANGSKRVTLTNVVTTVPVACGTPVVIVTDIFGTNAANGNVIQCVDCGIRTSAGFVTVSGFATCNSNQYAITITNNTNIAITGSYNIYVDANGDMIFMPVSGGGADNLIQSGDITLAGAVGATATFNVTMPSTDIGKDIFVQLFNSTTNASRVDLITAPECAPLPITLNSFNVRRNDIKINLTWQTATEQNNKGFYIQRRVGNGTWESIGFVASQAGDGNSSIPLTYTFTDVNSERGMVQYRLQQLDLDGRHKYSDIRSIRGLGQNNKITIYPNPTRDGSVNIVFDDIIGNRSVMISDLTGRIVKQWKNVAGNSLHAEKLMPGMYHIRIRNEQTGSLAIEKLVVSQ